MYHGSINPVQNYHTGRRMRWIKKLKGNPVNAFLCAVKRSDVYLTASLYISPGKTIIMSDKHK